jgi:hypothetical protein
MTELAKNKSEKKTLKRACFQRILAIIAGASIMRAGPVLAESCVIENEKGVPQLIGLSCVIVGLLKAGLDLSVGVAAIFIIIGGIKYATATSDPKALISAKQTLTYAIIGLVVVVLSRVILTIIANVLGISTANNFLENLFIPESNLPTNDGGGGGGSGGVG